MAEHVVEVARRLAEEVLFPGAIETDRAPVVPLERLDALARAGLYGIAGPAEAGGLAAPDLATYLNVVETLAGGCLTTTFVWAQHHGAVRAVTATERVALRREWLGPLCRGERRAGVAFSGLRRPGPPLLTARAVAGGWILDGSAPWVTGWGRIDAVHTAARDNDGQIIWALVDARSAPTLIADPVELSAVAASATVTVRFVGHRVPDERVTLIQPFAEWAAADAVGLRRNGSLALGVTGRSCALLGPTTLDDELLACRAALDAALPDDMPAARAWAGDLAVRATTAYLTASGGRGILLDHHAQRLAREAMFLLVFGQTAAIRTAQRARLDRPAA